ncbi:MAG: AMP-binding protein [Prolixibacteraceae bacterium]|jgi:long-chain acyl-CoA synthetase|nr:AMP-binding protein [Prolixibacteraceae bacterium]
MKTLIDLFETSVQKFPNNPQLWEKLTDKYVPSTYKQIQQSVYEFGAGLMALGLKKGERAGLLSEGRNYWLISELSILYCGAINVPLSVKLEASELKFRMEHSGAKMLIISAGQAPKLAEIIDQLPSLETVILMDGVATPGSKEITFREVVDKGIAFLSVEENKKVFEQVWKNIQPDDVANISYTSGTTADPKGIMLTHYNYTLNVIQANNVLEITPDFITLATLPWDHSFAHTACLYTFMLKGASVASIQTGKTPLETLRNVPVNIQEIKPYIMMSVPALSKNFRKNIEKGIQSKGAFTEKLFNHAMKIGYAYNGDGWNKGKGWRALLKPQVLLYDKIIFSKIRANFGGNLQFFIGGGALLDIELQRFFSAIGVPVYQGYGLTEASPIISANCPEHVKFGSSGKVVKFLECKIVDSDNNELPAGQKGEIVVKGGNVMKGYWNNPKSTSETIIDGWLHTGDMGYLGKDGYLYVLGRFKSLLIGNDGEKYSPEGIEEAIVDQSPIIEQAMLYNNQNPYTVGMFVPNIPEISRQLEKHGIALKSDAGYAKALEMIKAEIDQYKKGGKFENMFPERWLPTCIYVLPEAFTEQNHMLNSTMKMVRGKITEHYTKEIDFLYTPEAKSIVNSMNVGALKKWTNS